MLRPARMLGRAAKVRAIRPARAAVARHSPKSARRRQWHRHPLPGAETDFRSFQFNARHARHAPALAAKAAQRALKDANCKANEIDAVLISTCTGYLCPASPATPVNGPGCVRTCSRSKTKTNENENGSVPNGPKLRPSKNAYVLKGFEDCIPLLNEGAANACKTGHFQNSKRNTVKKLAEIIGP